MPVGKGGHVLGRSGNSGSAGGGGGPVSAADVTFDPAGSIAATDVQAAIEELDTEKQAAASAVTLTGSQTLTNKTLTSPVVNGGTIDNAVIGGTTPAAITGTTITASTQMVTAAGNATTPGLQVGGTTGVGIYSGVTNQLGFATNGSLRLNISTVIAPQVQTQFTAGSNGAPSVSFSGDPNTGMYQVSGDNVGIAAGGTLTLQVGNAALGFYGTSPAAKQTVSGSRGGNAALASLLTALATIGLITDSSSA